MSAKLVDFETNENVAIVTLNDPGSYNAMSASMAEQLLATLLEASASSNAIILRGNEKAFCSGANLSSELVANAGEIDAGKALEEIFNPLALAIRDLPVPLISAVRGVAAGVGASLALIGDLIVTGENAYFLLPFRHVGLVPDGGAPWLLTKTVGRVRALELMLLGEKLPAAKAYEWGMVTRHVADQDVDETAFKLARNLASGATNAITLTRKAVWAAQSSDFETELHLERNLQREAGYHPNFVEGIKAFREKRRPVFGSPLKS